MKLHSALEIAQPAAEAFAVGSTYDRVARLFDRDAVMSLEVPAVERGR